MEGNYLHNISVIGETVCAEALGDVPNLNRTVR